MENVIDVQPRTPDGKGGARKLRREGLIPGVLYGHEEHPVPFAVDPLVFRKRIKASGYGRNTVLEVHGLDREVLALLKDTQVDPVKRHLMHIDLIEVRKGEDVHVEVPIELVGKAKGIIDGGMVQQVRRSIDVWCKPLTIPKQIEIDVTELGIGDVIHVGDVSYPEGIRPAVSETFAIVTIAAPPAAEATEAEAPVEGEEAAPAEDGGASS